MQPHHSRQWLNSPDRHDEAFEEQVAVVCEHYHQAGELLPQGVHTVCVDEKTGMQALELAAPTKPMRPGQPERNDDVQTIADSVGHASDLVRSGVRAPWKFSLR